MTALRPERGHLFSSPTSKKGWKQPPRPQANRKVASAPEAATLSGSLAGEEPGWGHRTTGVQAWAQSSPLPAIFSPSALPGATQGREGGTEVEIVSCRVCVCV